MQHMKKLLYIAFLLLQSTAAGAASGDDASTDSLYATQNHAQIRNVVADFVKQQTALMTGKVTYQIDEVDRRIVLPKCAQLEAFLPSNSQLVGNTSVGVRCISTPDDNKAGNSQARSAGTPANGWSIFVPVQIRFNLSLLTSARQLPSGHTLQEQDLDSQSTESSRAEGFTDPQQVIGKVLRFGIAAGQVLRENMLREPYSVKQGQVVQIIVQGNGFSIRSEGTALNNAGNGQNVQIRIGSNRIGSSRVISGIARTGGIVEIAP